MSKTPTPVRECFEYDWNEATGLETRTWEDQDGAITYTYRNAPLPQPVVTEELKLSYFANLALWLRSEGY